MRSRALLFALLFFAVASFALPLAAHAAIPFFGPIIPTAYNVCAASWGLLITVINNVISFLITLAIVFIAPLMIAYAGFLFVVNPVSPAGKEQAKGILLHTVVGIVVAMAGWLIVDAVMAVLYNPKEVGSTWSSLIYGNLNDTCIPLQGSLNQTPSGQNIPGITASGTPVVGGKFTFDPGIDAQVPTESGPLAALLSCMVTKVPAGVGRISSISDSLITDGIKTFAQCKTGGCQHSANSCHYGGRTCTDGSYAVDFGDDQNIAVLTSAAQTCGAKTLNEGTHLHVSVGVASGCSCDTSI